ncbi:hypothetical protein GCM10022244_13210 [Streptomyces gulbargensis]|uniref:Uncharacterized protein n=1 Tax=Streptomyces gulbargensis TaxID=364901 RepID=A0ABP7LLN8_9ACTN
MPTPTGLGRPAAQFSALSSPFGEAETPGQGQRTGRRDVAGLEGGDVGVGLFDGFGYASRLACSASAR